MVPMAVFGAAFTMLLPLTDRRSLEEMTSPELNMDIDVPDDLFFEDGNEEGWDGILGEEGDNILDKYSSVTAAQPGSKEMFAERAAAVRRAAVLARAMVSHQYSLLCWFWCETRCSRMCFVVLF